MWDEPDVPIEMIFIPKLIDKKPTNDCNNGVHTMDDLSTSRKTPRKIQANKSFCQKQVLSDRELIVARIVCPKAGQD